MKSIEAVGKSRDEAVEKALEELGLKRSEVNVEVVSEGSGGFLGIGGRKVRVKVTELGENEADPAGVVNTILEMMGVRFELNADKDDEATNIRIDSPEDEGLLIGRRGQTLDAIRHLTQRIVAARAGHNMVINIDIGDYRARREESLRARVMETADKVLDNERNYTLDPMSAQDRRLVHLMLADRDDLHTFTVGKGTRRCVVIAYGEAGSRGQNGDRDAYAERENETAYDRVPDPGFRSAPLIPDAEGVSDGPREERRPRDRRDGDSEEHDRRSRGRRRRGGRGGRDRSLEGGDRQPTEDRQMRDIEDRPDNFGNRRQPDEMERPRETCNRKATEDDYPREERQSRGRRDDRGGRRERGGRRDRDRGGRYGSDRDRDRPRRDDDYRADRNDDRQGGNGSSGEKVTLTEAPYVTDESGEKAFNFDLAKRVLQIDETGRNQKPAAAKNKRRR